MNSEFSLRLPATPKNLVSEKDYIIRLVARKLDFRGSKNADRCLRRLKIPAVVRIMYCLVKAPKAHLLSLEGTGRQGSGAPPPFLPLDRLPAGGNLHGRNSLHRLRMLRPPLAITFYGKLIARRHPNTFHFPTFRFQVTSKEPRSRGVRILMRQKMVFVRHFFVRSKPGERDILRERAVFYLIVRDASLSREHENWMTSRVNERRKLFGQ